MGAPFTAREYAQMLSSGSMSYDRVKKDIDHMGLSDGPTKKGGYNTPRANFLDDIASETAKLGVFSADINRLYRDASMNYNVGSSAWTPIEEGQRMYGARSTAANARVVQASQSGSSVSKATTTAASAEAAKRTLLGS